MNNYRKQYLFLNTGLIAAKQSVDTFAFIVPYAMVLKEIDKLLVIDDDEHTLLYLQTIFEKVGFSVFCAVNGHTGIELAKEIIPDLIVLDVIMPGMDGIELCQELRQTISLKKTIITFYTARSEDYSHIAGFSAGADDYIVKSVRPDVLVMRIKALLKRRRLTEKSKTIKAGPIQLDRERYIVIKGNKKIAMPRKEFEILALLLASPRKVFSRGELYREIWGDDFSAKSRTIDVHIRKLREKIGEGLIRTIRGVGYFFETKQQDFN